MSAAHIWWTAGNHGLCGYVGAGASGIQFTRHAYDCLPGLWRVGITGWTNDCNAVVDDFGDLVQVRGAA